MSTIPSDVGPGYTINIIPDISYCAELVDPDGNVVGFADDQPTADGAVTEAVNAWKRNENKKLRRDVPTAGEW
jgi:hypothetical protein